MDPLKNGRRGILGFQVSLFIASHILHSSQQSAVQWLVVLPRMRHMQLVLSHYSGPVSNGQVVRRRFVRRDRMGVVAGSSVIVGGIQLTAYDDGRRGSSVIVGGSSVQGGIQLPRDGLGAGSKHSSETRGVQSAQYVYG